MFKPDFIVLFCNTMIECFNNGKCTLDILRYIDENTDFGGIDWCKFAVSRIRRCKNKWKRADKSSFFAGALTILLLIYVDGTTCKGKEEARSIHPFEFWTFEQLHIRQEVELRCGGFGLGNCFQISE
ncbi:hypothetical protein Hanom_Chr17g01536731 [Helianthus anomalus]